jgi:hypothetical protein
MIRGHHFMLNGKSVPLALALPLILILSWGRPAIADDAIDKVRALLVRYPHSGADLLSQIDRDGNGIDQKEIDRANRVLTARIRAKNISERLIYDLNNDFEVTRSEVEQVADYDREPILLGEDRDARAAKRKRHREEVAAEVMQSDANGNGKLEWLEISESLRMSGIDNQFEIFSVMLAQALLNADPNKDGILTSAESAAILNEAALKKAEK